MDKLMFVCFFCVVVVVCTVNCKAVNLTNGTEDIVQSKPASSGDKNSGTGVEPEVTDGNRQTRQWVSVFKKAAQCGFEMACFLDSTENDLRQQRQLVMIEADTQDMKSNRARGISNEKPSDMANTVEGIIAEMTNIIQDTVTGWFRDGKDDDAEESTEKSTEEQDSPEEHSVEEESADDEDEDESQESDNGETRGKKKKKLRSLIKLLILGAVLKAKLTVLLQLFSAALQVKFFLIALAGLIINKIRLWYDLKKGHQPQKVIYYEHAQHQHHYDHLDDEHSSGGFWGRAYEVPKEDDEDAQDLAYKAQKPIPWSSQQQ